MPTIHLSQALAEGYTHFMQVEPYVTIGVLNERELHDHYLDRPAQGAWLAEKTMNGLGGPDADSIKEMFVEHLADQLDSEGSFDDSEGMVKDALSGVDFGPISEAIQMAVSSIKWYTATDTLVVPDGTLIPDEETDPS